MEKTFTGWIPKSLSKKLDLKNIMYDSANVGVFAIYKTKDTQNDWADKDWPPVKVKITIETL